jgi:hypothetical protein
MLEMLLGCECCDKDLLAEAGGVRRRRTGIYLRLLGGRQKPPPGTLQPRAAGGVTLTGQNFAGYA